MGRTDRDHPPQGDQPPVASLAPLTIRAYRRLWMASIVSATGTFMQLTVAPWLMQEMTGSPLMVSLVTTALFLPRLVLTLPAGALADVVDRRTLVLVGQSLSALAVGTMAVLQHLGALAPIPLLGLTLLLGIGNIINLPSLQTLIPDLVPRHMFAQAITLQAAASNVARAVGPSIGGGLAALGLSQLAFSANAVSFRAVIAVVLTFPRAQVADPQRRRLWRSTVVGWRYARFTPAIRTLLAIATLFFLTTASLQALLPSLVSDELGEGAGWFGLLYGAFGAGALLAALTRQRIHTRSPRLMLPGAITGFGVAGVLLGLSPTVWLAVLPLLGAGACWVWTITTLNASLQTLAPTWVRGRVVSLFVLTWGMQPIGAVAAGSIAEMTGAATAITILTGITVLLGLLLFRAELPILSEIEEAEPVSDVWGTRGHPVKVGGAPILVLTTWRVDPDQLEGFMAVLREVRRQRLRTGATRWSVFRDASRPEVVTEAFTVPDWEEHLAQHARLDEEAQEVLARARTFDREQRPRSRHLAGLDVRSRSASSLEQQLVTIHEEYHEHDGSLPLD